MGERATWFRNVLHTPEVVLHVGGRRLEATAGRVSAEDAERALRDYASRHPVAFRDLARWSTRSRVERTDQDIVTLTETVSFVSLQPGSSR